jgi:hypothetical protein
VLVGSQARQHGGFVAHLDVERVDQHDGAALARVVAALEDGEVDQVGGADAQAREDGVAQGGSGWSRGSLSSLIRSMDKPSGPRRANGAMPGWINRRLCKKNDHSSQNVMFMQSDVNSILIKFS